MEVWVHWLWRLQHHAAGAPCITMSALRMLLSGAALQYYPSTARLTCDRSERKHTVAQLHLRHTLQNVRQQTKP